MISVLEKVDVESSKPTGRQSSSADRYWLVFAWFAVVVIAAAAVRWILDHPFGIHWDEALYFNNVLRDLHNLHSGSVRQLGSILIGGDIRRPPANLLVALPFLTVFGFHTAIARLVTLGCWGLSGWLVYLTTRRIGSTAAASFAVLVFCLSPEVISASIFFSTEGPFFVATALMLYCLSFFWTGTTPLRMAWIGLGVAIGLGFLAKSSFALIALPVLALTFLLVRRNYPNVQAISSLSKAGVLGAMIAAPWWLKNLGSALAYTKFAREQPRNSLGHPSLVTWAKWSFTVATSLIGPGLVILIGIVFVIALRKILRKEGRLDQVSRIAVITCASGVVPLVALQLSGTNHLLRYLCPALIPFAIAVGLLADTSGWIRTKTALVLSGTLVVAQIFMIVLPVAFPNNQAVDPGFFNGGLPWRIMVRFDQWDWARLRNISQGCGLEKPKIAFLGMGRPLNPPQLLYPWFAAGASPSERDGFSEPLWLWRYEQGPINWRAVMSLIEGADVVLTAPGFLGQATDRQDFDNHDNREFADRVSRDPRFRGPIRLKMGRFEPLEVDVFLRANLACSMTEQAMQ